LVGPCSGTGRVELRDFSVCLPHKAVASVIGVIVRTGDRSLIVEACLFANYRAKTRWTRLGSFEAGDIAIRETHESMHKIVSIKKVPCYPAWQIDI
jgi:hypothetical protein